MSSEQTGGVVADNHSTRSGRLAEKSVLVTGGGSGLGRALVTRFLDEGALVTVFDRDPTSLAEIAGSTGESLHIVAGDVTSAADNVGAANSAVRAYGGIDVFVGNAGIWDFNREILDMSVDEVEDGYRELFDVNVKGYLLGARAVAEHLAERRGSMIFTLSNAALYPRGGGVLYTASKHAGAGIVSQLAYELAPHVRVNAVAPGGMATNLRGPRAMGLGDHSLADVLPSPNSLKDHSALDVAPRPIDYVDTYVLLAASEESATITGSIFDISGVGTPKRAAAAT
jgi:NAD(P)-dependent dehydrogenase (short-subunit alcohol dehydrogenase family)